MIDPLEKHQKKHAFDSKKVAEIFFGLKYTGILLTNGNIGVCANLDYQMNLEVVDWGNLNDHGFRIIYHAYLNALHNYDGPYSHQGDIFELIDFKAYKNIVMVGHFVPLAARFEKENIPVHIFDKAKHSPELKPIQALHTYLAKADSVILTSTSIANNSFLPVIQSCAPDSKVFLLGPSSFMHKSLYEFRQIKAIFGVLFKKNDQEIINIIKNNGGTRDFLPRAQKVMFNENKGL